MDGKEWFGQLKALDIMLKFKSWECQLVETWVSGKQPSSGGFSKIDLLLSMEKRTANLQASAATASYKLMSPNEFFGRVRLRDEQKHFTILELEGFNSQPVKPYSQHPRNGWLALQNKKLPTLCL
ncbi:hypothetical protein CDAR_224891 [Caerostris darwini]|uniref:Uncharacterized protein n=1 Tax=Caerostris darwini TaxID=1538125 RepID=A0AAV4NA12_9ARAC|nr:hypothetical protein CDAR_224891 [Caerostris darwini]